MAKLPAESESQPSRPAGGGPLDLRIALAVVLVVAIGAVFWAGSTPQPAAPTPPPPDPAGESVATNGHLGPHDPADSSSKAPDPQERIDEAMRQAARMQEGRGQAPTPPADSPDDPAGGDPADDEPADDEPEPQPRHPAPMRRPKVDLGPVPQGAKAIPLDGGRILVLTELRQVWLEGRICQNDTPIEFLAVFSGGKDHEAILVVEAEPRQVNLAMMLIKLRAGGGVNVAGDVEVPRGDPVHFFVEWKAPGGETVRVRAEELILRRKTAARMRKLPWIFTGSRFVKSKETGRLIFLAAVDGVMAAVYRDPNAIFNNPLATGSDDEMYGINTALCPEIGTRAKIIIEAAPTEPYEAMRAKLVKEARKIKAEQRRRREAEAEAENKNKTPAPAPADPAAP